MALSPKTAALAHGLGEGCGHTVRALGARVWAGCTMPPAPRPRNLGEGKFCRRGTMGCRASRLAGSRGPTFRSLWGSGRGWSQVQSRTHHAVEEESGMKTGGR